MGIWGEDWASYQSAAPDTSGLSFAFVKVTEGTGYVNPEWQSQRDHAKANGLVWGGYHYPHMGASVQAEADFFLSQAAWKPGDLVCLDWEGYDAANSAVSKADQAAYKDAWLRYVKSRLPHNPVGMYCNVDYWRNVDTTGYYGDFLWIATAGLPAGQPGITAPWLFHQYSAASVDHDYCHLASTQALRDWALAFASPSTPPGGTDMPMTPADVQLLLNTRVPLAKLPGGYVPSVAELLNGSKTADDQLAALEKTAAAQMAAITALVAQLGAQHSGVDTAAVVSAVQAAIAAAVVHVDVAVTQPPAAP
jgi:hypothetical protein